MRRRRMKITVEEPPQPDGFIAVKPKKGQWLVSLKREKIYGQLTQVRSTGSFKYRLENGRFIDTQHKNGSIRTWEETQYDWGEMRFVDEIPKGFTWEGNGWKRADG